MSCATVAMARFATVLKPCFFSVSAVDAPIPRTSVTDNVIYLSSLGIQSLDVEPQAISSNNSIDATFKFT